MGTCSAACINICHALLSTDQQAACTSVNYDE